jgi:hypothetical protein
MLFINNQGILCRLIGQSKIIEIDNWKYLNTYF